MVDILPKFPVFKRLDPLDQGHIERFTNQFSPYSDFDFVNLSCWHDAGDVGVSVLNKNLVLSFPDYLNNQTRYTFLGSNETNNTVVALLDYLKGEFLEQKLMYVPEICLDGLDMSRFLVEIDFDNSDYVYDLHNLCDYIGPDYSKKRQYVKSFTTKYSEVDARVLDLDDLTVQSQILDLYDHWSSIKSQDSESPYLRKEKDAMGRFFRHNFKESYLLGIYIRNQLHAYSIYRVLPNGFAVCYFAKVNLNYFGLNEYLMREGSRFLVKLGASKLNYEEDMGLPGLRFSKNSFRPTDFLRKFSIQNN